jgi:hypothetical protein
MVGSIISSKIHSMNSVCMNSTRNLRINISPGNRAIFI